MSEWTIFAFSASTVVLLGFGLGFTYLEFHRADKRLKEEEARAARPTVETRRGPARGRAK